MIIHGKERGFKMTIGASAKIAELCPGGELTRLEEALGGPYSKAVVILLKVIHYLAEGYELEKMYTVQGYIPDTISIEELSVLSPQELSSVKLEAMEQMSKDMSLTVEIEEPKNADPAKV